MGLLAGLPAFIAVIPINVWRGEVKGKLSTVKKKVLGIA
jgi:hypothetical protein